MAYKRVNWKNNPPSSATPISAENLNIMDKGIEAAHQAIEQLPEKFPKKMSQLEDDVGYAKSEDVGKVSQQTNAQFEKERHTSDKEYASGIIQSVGGKEIVAEDASSKPLHNLKLFGKTEQVVTTGKQMLNLLDATYTFNGVTVTIKDGIITVVGTATASGGRTNRLSERISIPVGDYTLSRSILGKSAMCLTNSDNQNDTYIFYNESSTITLTETKSLYFGINVVSGETYNETFTIQLEKGTVSTDYEPYTGGFASPSPDWSQELDSLGEIGNLFDKNAVIKDRAVSDENGTEFAASGYYASDYIDVSELKDIYITTTNSAAQWGSFYDADKKFISGFSGFNTTRKVPSNAKYMRVTVVANVLDTFVINEGTAPLPWRPYTGQKEIESRITGKNLLPYPYIGKSQSTNGANMIIQNDGSVVCSGTPTGYIGITLFKSPLVFADKFLVCLLGKITNINLDITIYDENDDALIYAKSVTANNSVVIDVANFRRDYWFYLTIKRNSSGTPISGTAYPMIVLGDVAPTQYEPYQPTHSLYTPVSSGLPGLPLGQTIPDVIKNSPAHMSGVYWDEEDQQYYISDTVDYENGKYVQRLIEITASDVDNWYKDTNELTNTYYFFVGNESKSLRSKIIANCTHFKYREYPYIYGINNIFGFNSACDCLYFNTEIPTIKEWKEWVSSNTVTVQYVLKEPIITELSDEEKQAFDAIHSNYPNTTIMNDCGAYMEVDYVADTKKYIDNKFAGLAQQMV